MCLLVVNRNLANKRQGLSSRDVLIQPPQHGNIEGVWPSNFSIWQWTIPTMPHLQMIFPIKPPFIGFSIAMFDWWRVYDVFD